MAFGVVATLVFIVVVFLALSTIDLHGAQELYADPLVDITACQQSAIILSKQPLKELSERSFRLVCPVTKTNVTKDILDISTFEKEEAVTFGYTDMTKYAIDKFFWQTQRDCYKKVGNGKSALFGHPWFGVLNPFAEVDKTYCVICATVIFDEDVQNAFSDSDFSARKYFSQKKIGEKTLQETMEYNQDPDIQGFFNPTFKVTERQHVIYMRSNTAHFAQQFADAYNLFLEIDDQITVSDFETVQVVSGQEQVANHCDVISNSFTD